jgi:hypothetical protein
MLTTYRVCYGQHTALVEFGVYRDRDEAFRVCAGLRGQGYDAGVYGSNGGRLEHIDPTRRHSIRTHIPGAPPHRLPRGRRRTRPERPGEIAILNLPQSRS